jgi:hypothetical protein
MTNITVKKLVTFAILMESGEGVRAKAPSYVAEKWSLVMSCPENLLPTLLDIWNQKKYEKYCRQWRP